jgi:hypothetical protein
VAPEIRSIEVSYDNGIVFVGCSEFKLLKFNVNNHIGGIMKDSSVSISSIRLTYDNNYLFVAATNHVKVFLLKNRIRGIIYYKYARRAGRMLKTMERSMKNTFLQ